MSSAIIPAPRGSTAETVCPCANARMEGHVTVWTGTAGVLASGRGLCVTSVSIDGHVTVRVLASGRGLCVTSVSTECRKPPFSICRFVSQSFGCCAGVVLASSWI